MKALMASLVVGQLLAVDASQRLISDVANGPVRGRSEIRNLSEDQVRKHALELLAPPRVRLGRFLIYGSEGDWYRAREQGGTECSYDRWRSSLDKLRLMKAAPCPTVSEALKIGADIVLRRVDANCHTQSTVISGNADPTQVNLSGDAYDILDFTIPLKSSKDGRTTRGLSSATFFVRTAGPATIERARRVLQYLQSAGNVDEASVVLRNDQWFASECGFPILFPFGVPLAPIPERETFLKSAQTVCVALRPWPVRCY